MGEFFIKYAMQSGRVLKAKNRDHRSLRFWTLVKNGIHVINKNDEDNRLSQKRDYRH